MNLFDLEIALEASKLITLITGGLQIIITNPVRGGGPQMHPILSKGKLCILKLRKVKISLTAVTNSNNGRKS